MRVTKAQAQANRAHIVETASALFREHGYDGIGVADLMAAAGFTHGGFYKHFRSKADLMAEAAGSGFSQTMQRASGADLTVFIENYLSRRHRDARGNGCTLAALCSDAARQPDAVKTSFAEGIERLLADLAKRGDMSEGGGRAATLDTLAHLVGAIVLSRACPDESPLADEILAASRGKLLGAQAEGSAN